MKPILIQLLFLTLMGCTPPSGEGMQLQVQLLMPEEYSRQSSAGTTVKLINTANGMVYTAQADASGNASFQAEYGTYRISAQLTLSTEDIDYLFNGGQENIRLTPKGSNISGPLIIPLKSSKTSRIIIKEIYYSGCYDENGKQYGKDSYISLYNNSDATVWLDSLCIGIVAPIVASKISPWITNNSDSLPIAYIGWQFPGTGEDYPLPPGATTTIAINAVDHTGPAYNHPNSVDLSKIEWAFYHPLLTGTDIAVGVKPLNMFLRIGTLNSYVFGIAGPSVVIYRIHGISAEQYVTNPANLQKEPPQYKGMDYIMIPTSWAIDCVDCVENATKQGFKRVPSFLDAESTYLPSGKYSGRSLHRKIAGNKNGRIIYQDTNNSFQDFEERVPELKK